MFNCWMLKGRLSHIDLAIRKLIKPKITVNLQFGDGNNKEFEVKIQAKGYYSNLW